MLVLYNPVSSGRKTPVLPMSLLSLGAVLEERGRSFRVVDGNLIPGDRLQALDQVIGQTGACILGVTVMPGPQLSDAVPLCRALKERHPNLTIVWGGYFPSQHWQCCLRSPYVDYVLRGHSEVAFADLVDAVLTGQDPTLIAGVASRDALGTPRSTGLPRIPRPDELPPWPYDRVRVADYLRPTFLGSRTIGQHSSYGCPFKCNFCAVVNLVNGAWLSRSAEQTAADVRFLVTEHGANAIEFNDNNFFVHQGRAKEFAERVMDLDIGWWGEARIDTLLKYSDATWDTLRRSGLRMVFLGAESGSDETLAAMNKGGTMSSAKTIELVVKMKGLGIIPELSFVVGNPPDPERDLEGTLSFIKRVKRLNPDTEIILYAYTPVPLAGTLLEEAERLGFAFPETLEGWVDDSWRDFSQRRSLKAPGLAPRLQKRLRDFESVLNAYYPTRTDRRLTGVARFGLRATGAWRYWSGYYANPVELRLLHRLIRYRRPETAGF